MKKILTLLLSALLCGSVMCEDFLTGGTFVKSATDGSQINFVGQTTSETAKMVVGRTYSSEMDMLEITTAGTQTIDLQLSTGTLVRVHPSSEFRVDAFNQMVKNSDAEPELVVSADYILNLALMNGEAFIITPKYSSPNTMCVLQTPLANLELNGGKYFVKASQKFVICYVVEGSVGVFNPKTNKKDVIETPQMAFIVPFPGEIGVMVTSKGIDSGELLKQINTLKEIDSSKDSVIFAVIDKKIVGIKVK